MMRGVLVQRLCLVTVTQWTAVSVSAFLFVGRESAETTTALPKSLQTLIRVLKTSESAIGWLENKTSNSLRGLLNSDGQTVTDIKEVTPAPDRRHFFTWLRDRLHYSGSPDSEETSSDASDPGDSEESLIFLHRTQDHGFSWGASVRNKSQVERDVEGNAGSDTGPGRGMQTVQSALSYIYHTALAIRERGKHILQAALSTVTARVSHPAGGCAGGEVKPVCAVDPDDRYTVFPDLGSMTRHNQEHGTEFRVHATDVCIDLLARRPELFYNALNSGPTVVAK